MAQLASASGLGPEGPVFESQYPDTKEKQSSDFQVVAFLFSGFWGIMHQRKMHQRKIHVDFRWRGRWTPKIPPDGRASE